MNIHQGKKLRQLFYEQGLNPSKTAKMLGVTSQKVSHDFQQEIINPYVLKPYLQLLEISIEDFNENTPATKILSNSTNKEIESLKREIALLNEVIALQKELMKNKTTPKNVPYPQLLNEPLPQ